MLEVGRKDFSYFFLIILKISTVLEGEQVQ